MKVEYYARLDVGYGNVLFDKAYPMRAGKFPASHPCHENPRPTVFSRSAQPASDDALGQFRARGYMASCFPEGDGFAFDPPEGKNTFDVVQDLIEVFGFDVTVCRP